MVCVKWFLSVVKAEVEAYKHLEVLVTERSKAIMYANET